jgi:hypothetical protein
VDAEVGQVRGRAHARVLALVLRDGAREGAREVQAELAERDGQAVDELCGMLATWEIGRWQLTMLHITRNHTTTVSTSPSRCASGFSSSPCLMFSSSQSSAMYR